MKREISTLYSAGANETAEMIQRFDENAFAFTFAGVNRQAVDVLTSGALAEYAGAISGLRANATKVLFDKKKLNDKIVEGVIQGSSFARTTRQLDQLLKQNGLIAIVAKNGARIKTLPYANTLVRSQSMSAYNLGAKATMLDSGRRFAKIATLRPDLDGPDICNKFERQVYIELTDPTQLPPYHPNCRHVPIPVSFAELKASSPERYRAAIKFFEKK